MRSTLLVFLTAVLFAAPLRAADATRRVTLGTSLHSRTSLRVSTHVLVFAVDADGGSASSSIDYVAAARTSSDGEVVLTVEPLGSIDGPGGAADVEVELSVEGQASRPLAWDAPVSAARWTGSGSREGRLTFALRAAASGSYVVPVRLVLSTP